MEEQEFRTHKDQRVRLKGDGQDAFYPLACAGSEGWVRNQDHDHLGFPMVYLEWDKDHWAYNGEQDGWTFEAHFDPVATEEGNMAAKDKDDIIEVLRNLLETHTSDEDDDEEEEKEERPRKSKKKKGTGASRKQYREQLEQATDFAEDADAFLLVAIQREGEKAEDLVLTPAVFHSYLDEVTGLVLEVQLSRLAAASHGDVTQRRVTQILSDNEE